MTVGRSLGCPRFPTAKREHQLPAPRRWYFARSTALRHGSPLDRRHCWPAAAAPAPLCPPGTALSGEPSDGLLRPVVWHICSMPSNHAAPCLHSARPGCCRLPRRRRLGRHCHLELPRVLHQARVWHCKVQHRGEVRRAAGRRGTGRLGRQSAPLTPPPPAAPQPPPNRRPTAATPLMQLLAAQGRVLRLHGHQGHLRRRDVCPVPRRT